MDAKTSQVLEDNNANFANGCAEPGYDDKPVIMANWNNIEGAIFDELESEGFACEWEDEWIVCDTCNKAFRSSPNSYGWEMFGAIFDGFALCGDCIDPDEYLESIENKPRKALTCSLLRVIDPTDHGYTLVNDEYENGFHPGQNDDPAKILADLLADDPHGKYVFAITGQGQFDIDFAVYRKD
jgi:hypothetical protein